MKLLTVIVVAWWHRFIMQYPHSDQAFVITCSILLKNFCMITNAIYKLMTFKNIAFTAVKC